MTRFIIHLHLTFNSRDVGIIEEDFHGSVDTDEMFGEGSAYSCPCHASILMEHTDTCYSDYLAIDETGEGWSADVEVFGMVRIEMYCLAAEVFQLAQVIRLERQYLQHSACLGSSRRALL